MTKQVVTVDSKIADIESYMNHVRGLWLKGSICLDEFDEAISSCEIILMALKGLKAKLRAQEIGDMPL